MNDLIKIENIGYTANNNPRRAIRSGAEYEELIPSPEWQEEVVKRNADVSQTVHEMQHLIKKSAWQTKELSKRLLAKDIYSTCKNIWHFLFEHCKYKEDDEGQEQLRTPALSWYLRTIRGIDCDDFSIFASTLLYNLGIPHYLRIAKYSKGYFQHVYVVVPQTDKKYITIDAVLDEYDAEKEPTQIKDFLVMDTNRLNGIDVTVLSGIEDDALNELQGVLSGADFERINELEGLGQIPTREEELGAIYNHLIRTRNVIRRNPHFIKQVENPDTFLGMLDYAIGYWDTNKRDEALNVLSDKEDELNSLNGLDTMPDGYECTNIFYGIEGLNGIVALGKVRKKRGFFKKVKEAAKKVGQGIKKVAQKLLRYNPLSAAVRAGVLLAMKTNFMKIAEKIKWGYLTEDEARKNGFDVDEWRNAKVQLAKIENMFVNTLKGRADKLKHAILSGRAGGLSGIDSPDEALGVAVAAATGGSIAAAMPFIKKVLDIVKHINFKKLIAKVSSSKLMRGRKAAEREDDNAPEAETAASEPSEETENQNTPAETTSTAPTEVNSGNAKRTTESSGEEKSTEETPTENNTNLPTAQGSSNIVSNETSDDSNPVTKAMNWVKEHPLMTVAIAGGLILAISPSARHAIGLGGTSKRGRKRKGKAKRNPPRTISGVKRKTNSKSKPKPKAKRKSRGKGRGGNTPKVKL